MNKLTPVKALRALTGIFNPKHAVDVISLCNLLARHLDGDDLLEDSFLQSQFQKCGIELNLDRDETQLKSVRAKKEIEILRQFGNKDCTAMADEELKRNS